MNEWFDKHLDVMFWVAAAIEVAWVAGLGAVIFVALIHLGII